MILSVVFHPILTINEYSADGERRCFFSAPHGGTRLKVLRPTHNLRRMMAVLGSRDDYRLSDFSVNEVWPTGHSVMSGTSTRNQGI